MKEPCAAPKARSARGFGSFPGLRAAKTFGHPVQPLDVVDHEDQRLFRRGLGEEPEHSEPDQQPVGRIARTEPKGGRERISLRLRQPIKVPEQRRTELLQHGVRDLRLRLHTGCPRNQIVQQCGLSGTGFAPQRKHAAVPGPDIAE
jgi:hypothetical protein